MAICPILFILYYYLARSETISANVLKLYLASAVLRNYMYLIVVCFITFLILQ